MAEKIRSLTLAMRVGGAFTASLAPPGLALPSPGIGGRKMAQEGKRTLEEKRVIFTRKKGLCEWQARLAKWASQSIQPRYESPKT